MSQQHKRILWPLVIVLVTAVGTLAFIIKRPRNLSERSRSKPITAPAKGRGAPIPAAKANGPTARNLSLQPEAFNLSRRLGQRFSSGKREISTFIGTLAIGADQKIVTAIRRQTDDGEQVEIHVAGSPGFFTWDASQGAFSAGAPAMGSDRELIERLVFDNADQFVFAQLRGATYQTIAQHARPSEAGGWDNYSGPLWDVVRIAEPEQFSRKLPQSHWRLYYVNAATGLIDKVVSEEQGRTIVAEITNWTTQAGETAPTHIAWKRDNQTIMEFSLTNLTFSAQ